MTTLWHYTCDHGRHGIGEGGLVFPAAKLSARQTLPWTADLVWMTDLAVPQRDALGLTMHVLKCDRTAHRYQVDDPSGIERWVDYAQRTALPRGARTEIENEPGSRPMHWWVSPEPVRMTYAPIGALARAAP